MLRIRADLAIELVLLAILVREKVSGDETGVRDLNVHGAGPSSIVEEFICAIEVAHLEFLPDDEFARLRRVGLGEMLGDEVHLGLADRLQVRIVFIEADAQVGGNILRHDLADIEVETKIAEEANILPRGVNRALFAVPVGDIAFDQDDRRRFVVGDFLPGRLQWPWLGRSLSN